MGLINLPFPPKSSHLLVPSTSSLSPEGNSDKETKPRRFQTAGVFWSGQEDEEERELGVIKEKKYMFSYYFAR